MFWLLVEDGISKKIFKMNKFDMMSSNVTKIRVNTDITGLRYSIIAKRYLDVPQRYEGGAFKVDDVETILNIEFVYAEEKERYYLTHSAEEANAIKDYDEEKLNAAFTHLCDSIFKQVATGMFKKDSNFVTITFDINNLFLDLIEYYDDQLKGNKQERSIERDIGADPDEEVDVAAIIKSRKEQDDQLEYLDV